MAALFAQQSSTTPSNYCSVAQLSRQTVSFVALLKVLRLVSKLDGDAGVLRECVGEQICVWAIHGFWNCFESGTD